MKSWRTTLLGVIGVLTVVLSAAQALLDGDPATNPNWEIVIAALSSGIGLILARDNKVTSKEAGAE